MSRCAETGKKGWATRAEARAELRRLQSTPRFIRAGWPDGLGKVLRRVYRCTYCRAWHITSQVYRPRKDIPA